jgi:hypothetical protein
MRQNDTPEPVIGSIAPIWRSRIKKEGGDVPERIEFGPRVSVITS